MSTQKVWKIYNELIERFDNEFNILLEISEEELLKNKIDRELVSIILKNRKGEIEVKPGYDGLYGVPLLGKN